MFHNRIKRLQPTQDSDWEKGEDGEEPDGGQRRGLRSIRPGGTDQAERERKGRVLHHIWQGINKDFFQKSFVQKNDLFRTMIILPNNMRGDWLHCYSQSD